MTPLLLMMYQVLIIGVLVWRFRQLHLQDTKMYKDMRKRLSKPVAMGILTLLVYVIWALNHEEI